MELIIEEISRGQKLLHRHKYQQVQVSVGRGYQNDIILSDPHVCAEHLDIIYNGNDWILKDKNTLNGSFVGRNKLHGDTHDHKIRSGDIVTLGKSQIRFIFPDHNVPESIIFSPFESLINFARHPMILAFSIILFGCLSAWVFHLNQAKVVNFSHLLVPTIAALVLFSLWPLCLSLTSFLTKNDARTFSQLGISFLFFNLFYVNDVFEKFIAFNFSSHALISDITLILPVIITFGLFWLNCHIGFHMSEKRRIVIASSLTLIFLGGSHLIKLSKQPEFDPKPRYNAALMTPSFQLNKGSSVSTFVEDSRALFVTTSQEVKK